jgi:parallel beta-helix repeat protein
MRTLMILSIAIGAAVGAAARTGPAGAQTGTITECPTEIAAPGSYVLVTNLIAAGDCILVAADFVTIDLAGFLLNGNGTGSGILAFGTPQSPRLGIAVRNGAITGFTNGIFLFLADGAMIEGVRAIDNRNNGIFVGNDSAVSGNIALRNRGDFGIFAGSDSRVSGNVARENAGIGINTGSGTIVTDNTARSNGRGIFTLGSNTVSGNMVQG